MCACNVPQHELLGTPAPTEAPDVKEALERLYSVVASLGRACGWLTTHQFNERKGLTDDGNALEKIVDEIGAVWANVDAAIIELSPGASR